ncbi:MAG: large conductance mechanosensitive channel protein MscL [Solirubrobacteraceae bacterium]|nr:large conductance mechanosensitive channel protein MscL [Patulibacter sp.]
MLKGFRDFLLRGNVVDLAVAVVIGAAFTQVVTTLNKGVITQIIALVGGVPDFNDTKWVIGGDGTPKDPGTAIYYGSVITAVLNFIIVAAVVYFVVIVPMNKALERFNKPKEEAAATLTKDQELLIEIRDALAKR